jgi:hypothetical protein
VIQYLSAWLALQSRELASCQSRELAVLALALCSRVGRFAEEAQNLFVLSGQKAQNWLN